MIDDRSPDLVPWFRGEWSRRILTDLSEFRIFFRAKEGQLGVTFARFELDATSAGQAKLAFNSVSGLVAWLDAVPMKLTPETVLDLTSSRHRMTFAIELSERKEPLRVELSDVAGSTAKVQLMSGK